MFKPRAIQSRVLRTMGRQGVVGCGYLVNFFRTRLEGGSHLQCLFNNERGILVPRGAPTRGEMVGPERKGIAVAPSQVLPEHLRRRIGDECGSGGRPKLVGHNSQFLALAGKPKDGFEQPTGGARLEKN